MRFHFQQTQRGARRGRKAGRRYSLGRVGRALLVSLICVGGLSAGLTERASAAPAISVVSSRQWGPDSIGYEHIVGEVRNSGSSAAWLVRIDFNLYSASNQLLATDFTYSDTDPLPGEKSPFGTIFKPQPGYDHYSITGVSFREPSTAPNHNFTTTVTNTFVDSAGYWHVVGQVRNNNTTRSKYVNVVFTLYQSGGGVADTDFTYVNGSDDSGIDPGATVSFELFYSGPAPAGSPFATVTESSTPPTGSAPATTTTTTSAAPSTTTTTTGSTSTSTSPTSSTTTSRPATTTTTTSQRSGADTTRLSGGDRIETAIAVSGRRFTDRSGESVVLARADAFPDALASAPLAVRTNGPILLTARDRLDGRVQDEIGRVLTPGRTVYLVGGTSALGTEVEQALRSAGYSVIRYGGRNRFETATLMAEGSSSPTAALLVTGDNFPDALSAGAAAGATGGVVLLTAGSSMPPETAAYLQARPSLRRYAIGGPAGAADPSATSVRGADRFETSTNVARQFFSGPGAAGVSSGASFADALPGGADMGRLHGPLLLTRFDSLPDGVASYLAGVRSTLRSVAIYGGTSTVSDQVEQQIRQTTA